MIFNDNLPTQVRKGQTFPQVIPRDNPRFGWKNIQLCCKFVHILWPLNINCSEMSNKIVLVLY